MTAPRISVKASQQIGKLSDSQATRAVIATRLVRRSTANAVDSRSSRIASSSAASQTNRFDYTVKNANELKNRAAGALKWFAGPVPFAADIALIRTPARTQAAVAPNQSRAHLGDIRRRIWGVVRRHLSSGFRPPWRLSYEHMFDRSRRTEHPSSVLPSRPPRGCGEIGIHDTFRSYCPYGRGGSSPSSRISAGL
jgi:hypothetical protein